MRLKCKENAVLIDEKTWKKIGLAQAVILLAFLSPQFSNAHDVDGDHREGLAEAIHAPG